MNVWNLVYFRKAGTQSFPKIVKSFRALQHSSGDSVRCLLAIFYKQEKVKSQLKLIWYTFTGPIFMSL